MHERKGQKIAYLSNMRNSSFQNSKKYFHVSLNYKVSSPLKVLDWIFIQKLIKKNSEEYNIEIQSLVLMDTHLHMLIGVYETNENFFCTNVQKSLSVSEDCQNLAEPVLNYAQYLNTYKYIYRNPVVAGLCNRVEEYEYSSLYSLIGKAKFYLPVHDQLGFIQNPLHILKWLNGDHNFKNSQLSWVNSFR